MSMAYLFLFVVFFSFPVLADFEYRKDMIYAQEMVTSGNSVIDDNQSDDNGDKAEATPSPAISADIVADEAPTPPTPPKTEIPTKKVVKKIPAVKIERSYRDERIDDSYVQDLIKQRFNFNNPIE